jgi:hypothetical protein
VKALRFKHPEPTNLRSNAFGGIFKNGDEGCQLSMDDQAGLVYFKKESSLRCVHISSCDWVEFLIEEPQQKNGPR